MITVTQFPTQDELIDAAAHDCAQVIAHIQKSHGGRHRDGIARVVLTGGSNGIGMLRRLAEQVDSKGEPLIDFSRVEYFFGDERNVAVSDPESNEGQAREALFDAVPAPAATIHGWQMEQLGLDDAVAAYTHTLEKFAPQGFDLHLLGMGPEGHINSLFPHTSAVAEQEALCVAVTDSPKPPAQRGTLTLPAIARAERVWLLVSGAEKAEAAAAVVAGASPEQWPAAGAHGSAQTVLYVSEDAAGLIAE
ncbi:6-phosphogluconolactonase [Corynebacterium uberis]|uniref:6-phosphogluconolactonase n=1 Tax=Corynebacterium TaxID=1716 RepID=UPI001D0B1DA1|nr:MULTISPECIES: 6-phosphogluconolactonase [Corynebacterium]MCZ9308603.1 6-phosphogluconolactonase [Corynebacterium sp. c6VSa_13]UDL74248.1 6-phosphogluconolactonase [Corynebacterium uberis]UDL74872.1 6-phosphogluconolactonase [Corynebacterium uberis]UDL77086.1 6-phosphogluconolactonase [Corynebacterium uberis]UDL79369.1 6-phosphogluconolactonase [Corynebacterium uberis]